jgi:N-methylhydantoinase A
MLGFPEVIVPPYPGITSAMGLLTTDLKYDSIRTQFQVSGGGVDLDRLNADIASMESQLRRQFAADHLEAASMSFIRDGDLRYVGQGYELKIPLPHGVIGKKELADIWTGFHEAHKREYGHFFADNPIEIVNVRVVGVGRMPKIHKLTAPEGSTLAKARVKSGQCVFRIGGELRSFETIFYRRHLLPVGETFAGPAVVLQKDSTTVIPPGCSAINDPAGNLILTIAGVGDARL